MTTTTLTHAPWIGWVRKRTSRPHGGWRQVCQADTHAEGCTLLASLCALDEEWFPLKRGTHPDDALCSHGASQPGQRGLGAAQTACLAVFPPGEWLTIRDVRQRLPDSRHARTVEETIGRLFRRGLLRKRRKATYGPGRTNEFILADVEGPPC